MMTWAPHAIFKGSLRIHFPYPNARSVLVHTTGADLAARRVRHVNHRHSHLGLWYLRCAAGLALGVVCLGLCDYMGGAGQRCLQGRHYRILDPAKIDLKIRKGFIA